MVNKTKHDRYDLGSFSLAGYNGYNGHRQRNNQNQVLMEMNIGITTKSGSILFLKDFGKFS